MKKANWSCRGWTLQSSIFVFGILFFFGHSIRSIGSLKGVSIKGLVESIRFKYDISSIKNYVYLGLMVIYVLILFGNSVDVLANTFPVYKYSGITVPEYTGKTIPRTFDRSKQVPRLIPKNTFLIITTNQIVDQSTTLFQFIEQKNDRGFKVILVTQDRVYGNIDINSNVGWINQISSTHGWGNDIDDRGANNIRAWLQENIDGVPRWSSWNIKYLLIIGNNNDVPMKGVYPAVNVSTMAMTDYYYSELISNWDSNGNGRAGETEGNGAIHRDEIGKDAQISVGRIPSESIDILDNILQKIMAYENSPPESIDWRKNALIAAFPMGPIHNEDNELVFSTGIDFSEELKNDILQNAAFRNYRIYEKIDPYKVDEIIKLLKDSWRACESVDDDCHSNLLIMDQIITQNGCSDERNKIIAPHYVTQDTWDRIMRNWGNTIARQPSFVGYPYTNADQTDADEIECRIDNVTNTWKLNPFGLVVWKTHGLPNEAMNIMDLDHLTELNNDFPSFVVMGSCLNGYPRGFPNNLAYSALKNGAIGTLAASTTAAGSKADTLAMEFTKNLVIEQLGAGDAYKKYLSEIPANIRWNDLIFILYGDPSVGLFTSASR